MQNKHKKVLTPGLAKYIKICIDGATYFVDHRLMYLPQVTNGHTYWWTKVFTLSTTKLKYRIACQYILQYIMIRQ